MLVVVVLSVGIENHEKRDRSHKSTTFSTDVYLAK